MRTRPCWKYVVGEDRTHLFVLTRSKDASRESPDLKVFRLSVKQTELADRVGRFRARLANRDFTAEQLGGELYDLLLKPARPTWKARLHSLLFRTGCYGICRFRHCSRTGTGT